MKNKKLKRLFILLAGAAVLFLLYVQYANRNTTNMTGKQKMLRAIYPAIMGLTKMFGRNSKMLSNTTHIKPAVSFYNLHDTLNNSSSLSFETLKGKKILLVNTASDCGYTGQYADLQKLSELYKDKLVVIGFPANDFKEQEKGSDETIAQFCKVNYGVTFPLIKKSSVIKGNGQNIVYQWLSEAAKNGWNNQDPTWNFSKYLVDENGVLTHYFDPSISPLSDEVKEAIEK